MRFLGLALLVGLAAGNRVKRQYGGGTPPEPAPTDQPPLLTEPPPFDYGTDAPTTLPPPPPTQPDYYAYGPGGGGGSTMTPEVVPSGYEPGGPGPAPPPAPTDGPLPFTDGPLPPTESPIGPGPGTDPPTDYYYGGYGLKLQEEEEDFVDVASGKRPAEEPTCKLLEPPLGHKIIYSTEKKLRVKRMLPKGTIATETCDHDLTVCALVCDDITVERAKAVWRMKPTRVLKSRVTLKTCAESCRRDGNCATAFYLHALKKCRIYTAEQVVVHMARPKNTKCRMALIKLRPHLKASQVHKYCNCPAKSRTGVEEAALWRACYRRDAGLCSQLKGVHRWDAVARRVGCPASAEFSSVSEFWHSRCYGPNWKAAVMDQPLEMRLRRRKSL